MYDFLVMVSNPIGLLGVTFILVCYYFLSTGKWKSEMMRYQILNFTGSWLILFSIFFHWNLASFIIEIAWIIISIIGIYKIRIGKKTAPVENIF
jgi:hypothetical protein